jgi:hypothetical protein
LKDNKLPNDKKIPIDINRMKTVSKNISDMGHLTEKYGIREKQAKPQKGATGSRKKKEMPTK